MVATEEYGELTLRLEGRNVVGRRWGRRWQVEFRCSSFSLLFGVASAIKKGEEVL